jgi:hypothetical protein
MKYAITQKNFSQLLKKLGLKGTEARDLVTDLAVYAAQQALQGNVADAPQLVDAVSQIKGFKVEALKTWFCRSAPFRVKNGKLEYSKSAGKDMRASPAVQQAYEIHMLAVKWYEIETEKKAERILLELDVQSQYVAFMKNLQVKIESVKANGGTIKHAELLASLPAGNVVASISGIAAAAV